MDATRFKPLFSANRLFAQLRLDTNQDFSKALGADVSTWQANSSSISLPRTTRGMFLYLVHFMPLRAV
jgi:hypothetical protein